MRWSTADEWVPRARIGLLLLRKSRYILCVFGRRSRRETSMLLLVLFMMEARKSDPSHKVCQTCHSNPNFTSSRSQTKSTVEALPVRSLLILHPNNHCGSCEHFRFVFVPTILSSYRELDSFPGMPIHRAHQALLMPERPRSHSLPYLPRTHYHLLSTNYSPLPLLPPRHPISTHLK